MKIAKIILSANGALPIIFTIILVHSISYVRPERPEKKKQAIIRKNLFSLWSIVRSVFTYIGCNRALLNPKDALSEKPERPSLIFRGRAFDTDDWMLDKK